MKNSTTKTGVSRARSLRIAGADPSLGISVTFKVHLLMTEGSVERTVEVTDVSIDVGDLLRRIAQRAPELADVTDPFISRGELCFEDRGRRYLVGSFWTSEVMRFETPDISFALPKADGSDAVYRLDGDELDGISIDVVPFAA